MSEFLPNLRIKFYGVQGSGSTFPSSQEIEALQELTDYELLRRVFEDLEKHLDAKNTLDRSLKDLLGGPINKPTLTRYKKKFDIPKARIYGGWTTCVHVETADGIDLVFDCGSGFRNCALDLQKAWGDREERHLHIFGSHSHYDHTEGFDQAAVCFDPRNTIHLYGNYQFLYSLDSYLGIFSKFVRDDVLGVQTPINYRVMPAQFRAVQFQDTSKTAIFEKGDRMARDIHDLRQPIVLGETRVTAIEVFHPAPCLAYKVQRGGKTFVFCTDHELRHGPADARQKESEERDAQLIRHAVKADVLYRDAQYLRSDYDGLSGIGSANPVRRQDWGHSCIEDVQDMALRCGVKATYLGHHDPNRDWSELNWIDESLMRNGESREEKICLARAGLVLTL
jgi:phosphoribosyl 1,2-cyclic phosphodiesterase